MKPLGNRLLLKAPQAPDKIGRLWVPPEAQKEFTLCQAEIVAVGDDVEDNRLKPGAHVIVKRFGATALDDSKELWIVLEQHVLAILNVGLT